MFRTVIVLKSFLSMHLIALVICTGYAGAAVSKASGLSHHGKLSKTLIHELSKRYDNSKIELTGEITISRGSIPQDVESVSVTSENSGTVSFVIRNTGGVVVAEGVVPFAAWQSALFPSRRVLPGEKLTPELFTAKPVNVAIGMARELRGIILPVDIDLSTIESRQTILEGQFATTTAVRRIPKVRRGEMVMIEVRAGGITLHTNGTAEEPAYIDHHVRVLTSKSKKVLTGKLRADGHVEVQL